MNRERRTIKVTPIIDGGPAANLKFDDIGVEDTLYPFFLFVSQAKTVRVLEVRLQDLGIKIERLTEILTLTQDVYGVSVWLRYGEDREETTQARYIVGADECHSVVRKTVGPSFKGVIYSQDCVLADTEIHWAGDGDRLYFFLSQKGTRTVFPLGKPSTTDSLAPMARTRCSTWRPDARRVPAAGDGAVRPVHEAA